MNPMKHTLSVLDFLKSQTDNVILFYSGGKDSLVLLDILSKYFKVNLAFMYFVPELYHIEKYISFAEKKYDVRCIKYPHWMLSQYFNDNYFRFHQKEPIPNIKLYDVINKAKSDFGCQYVVMGMKKADSLNRRLMLNTYFMEAINLDSRTYYPLSNWKKADCIAYIRQKRLPFPISYSVSNSSGMDLNKEVLLWLRKNEPNDYEKVLKQFPFAESIIYGS